MRAVRGAFALPRVEPRLGAVRRSSSGVLRLQVPTGVEHRERRPAKPSERMRLLVVEDNPLDVELLAEYLAADGFACDLSTVPRLAQAERELQEGAFDLILLDLRLPDGEKLEALARVLAAAKAAPIVVLTGLDDERLAHDCLEAGADDYIEKGKLSPQVLRRAVGHALARSRARELRRNLEHADRLATVGKLAAGIAHEVNNPAALVRTNLEIMLESLRDVRAELAPSAVPAIDDLITMTRENLAGMERIVTIVRELGAFSRVESDRVEWVDLSDISRRTCSMLANEIRHRARLVLDLRSVPPIAAEPGKLTQVLVNLLVNAAHAIPAGAVGEHEVRVSTEGFEDHLVLAVEDTGCGIGPLEIERIFEPFFTTKARGEGTGLGLSIAAEIVAQFGGEIRVTSEVGRGTKFEVLLPSNTGLTVTRTTVPTPAGSGQGRRRVLLVDDEVGLAAALRRSLSRYHDVVVAHGGAQALALLEEDATFSAVLCDLMMPGLDGTDVHAALRERFPAMARRFAVLSGGAFTERATRFVEESGVTVVAKPASLARLLAVIDDLAARE